jgi:hypothetical protein
MVEKSVGNGDERKSSSLWCLWNRQDMKLLLRKRRTSGAIIVDRMGHQCAPISSVIESLMVMIVAQLSRVARVYFQFVKKNRLISVT